MRIYSTGPIPQGGSYDAPDLSSAPANRLYITFPISESGEGAGIAGQEVRLNFASFDKYDTPYAMSAHIVVNDDFNYSSFVCDNGFDETMTAWDPNPAGVSFGNPFPFDSSGGHAAIALYCDNGGSGGHIEFDLTIEVWTGEAWILASEFYNDPVGVYYSSSPAIDIGVNTVDAVALGHVVLEAGPPSAPCFWTDLVGLVVQECDGSPGVLTGSGDRNSGPFTLFDLFIDGVPITDEGVVSVTLGGLDGFWNAEADPPRWLVVPSSEPLEAIHPYAVGETHSFDLVATLDGDVELTGEALILDIE
ncbi:MAG: hypothetical protein ACREO0_01020 [Pseudoxanthomonas sp.]